VQLKLDGRVRLPTSEELTVIPPKSAPGPRTATATIDPVGRREVVPREHVINVTLDVVDGDPAADRAHATEMLRRCFGALGEPSQQAFRERSIARRGKGGTTTEIVVSVEGSAVERGRPAHDAVESMRAALAAAGYRVSLRERRECAESGCSSDAMMTWAQPDAQPPGWFTGAVCGRHGYRTCPGCQSVFRLESEASIGPAPSLHCEVCGGVLVEWGSSKQWVAELITPGTPR
jgi:hypothetical protein